jgi:hypothetical protein
MTQAQLISLVLLCVGMIGGAFLALTGLKRMRAAGSKIPSPMRLAVKLGLAASAFAFLATGANLAATIHYAPPVGGNWNSFLMSLTVSVSALFATGAAAWTQVAVASGDQRGGSR